MKFRLTTLLLSIILAAVAASAQTSRGTVSGTVTDPNGAAVAGATVTLLNTQTNLSRASTTNGEGFYRFDAVDPGTYSVRVSASGFAEVTKTNVPVLANQVADVSTQVSVGGTEITIDVTADAGALLQTESPVRGGNIVAAQITQLPVSGRNPVALA